MGRTHSVSVLSGLQSLGVISYIDRLTGNRTCADRISIRLNPDQVVNPVVQANLSVGSARLNVQFEAPKATFYKDDFNDEMEAAFSMRYSAFVTGGVEDVEVVKRQLEEDLRKELDKASRHMTHAAVMGRSGTDLGKQLMEFVSRWAQEVSSESREARAAMDRDYWLEPVPWESDPSFGPASLRAPEPKSEPVFLEGQGVW